MHIYMYIRINANISHVCKITQPLASGIKPALLHSRNLDIKNSLNSLPALKQQILQWNEIIIVSLRAFIVERVRLI